LICALAGEAPLDGSAASVMLTLPGHCLQRQGCGVCDAAQAMPGQDANFNPCHVQLTPMFGGVVKLHALEQTCGSALAEHILEALAEVRVQVVQHKMDATCRSMDLLDKIFNERHKVDLAATVRWPALGSIATNRLQVPRRTYS